MGHRHCFFSIYFKQGNLVSFFFVFRDFCLRTKHVQCGKSRKHKREKVKIGHKLPEGAPCYNVSFLWVSSFPASHFTQKINKQPGSRSPPPVPFCIKLENRQISECKYKERKGWDSKLNRSEVGGRVWEPLLRTKAAQHVGSLSHARQRTIVLGCMLNPVSKSYAVLCNFMIFVLDRTHGCPGLHAACGTCVRQA